MSKGMISFLVGVIVGFNGVRILTHAVYLTVIAVLALKVFLHG